MAEQKSIRMQLKDGEVLVHHTTKRKDENGKVISKYPEQSATFALPEYLRAAYGVLDNPKKLLDILEEHGVLLGILHQGLAQDVINVRAKARPNPTKETPDPKMNTATQRKKVAEHVPSTLPAEDGGKLSKREKAIKSLTDCGIPRDQAEIVVDEQLKKQAQV